MMINHCKWYIIIVLVCQVAHLGLLTCKAAMILGWMFQVSRGAEKCIRMPAVLEKKAV